jgi:Zn-dependent peptidase ImmA (M78 family)
VAAATKLRAGGHVAGGVLDVEELARSQGLEVVYGNFRHDGQLVGIAIEVPPGDPAQQRFVIAHELGHFHLRHTVPGSRIEREANAFASQLLIPRDELRSLLRNRPSIDQLRRHFAVSRQAACYAVEAVSGWSQISRHV